MMRLRGKLFETEDPLLNAALMIGDVEFLRNYVANKEPIECYLLLSSEESNIFHAAAGDNREELVREATKFLPLETLQLLLLQQSSENYMFNPLHTAAVCGNVEIVKLFLNVFRGSPRPLPDQSKRPWLAKTSYGQTPCHMALYCGNEECGLELLRMDMELLCNMLDNYNYSLLGLAVFKGLSKVALEILTSPLHSLSFSAGPATALQCVTFCTTEGEEICRCLLERKPELIKQTKEDGISVLQYWTTNHKLWPFECLLKCNDIIPDVRRIFVDLISATDNNYGMNPLHSLAHYDTSSEKEDVDIAKLLIDTYRQEAAAVAKGSGSSSTVSEEAVFPWLMQSKEGLTPLDYAIHYRKEHFAMYIMSVDNVALLKSSPDLLFTAIDKQCFQVAKEILDIVDEKGWTQFLTNQHEQLNALHVAPLCGKDFFEKLLKRHPEFLKGVDKKGHTVFHYWVGIGKVWPFEYVLQSIEINGERRSNLVKLISARSYRELNNPLHVAAGVTTTHDSNKGHQIARILVEAYKEENPNWRSCTPGVLPWFEKNIDTKGPMHLAMRNQNEKLALYYLLSQNQANRVNQLLDYYTPEHKTLFLAIENNCIQVAKEILANLDKGSWTKYLVDSSDGRSVLHLAPSCTDKDFGIWLVNEAPEFITQPDKSGKTPLDKACDVGAAWIIQAILQKDPSALSSSPLAWVRACENGHVSVINALINDYPEKFRSHCIKHKESPLHHIQLSNHIEYVNFLNIPGMKDLINIQDFRGSTPLHKSIQNRNMFLTETLLVMDNIMYNIKNEDNQTAIDMLEQVCDEDYEWDQMCKRIGFDPRIKTTYFQRKTNLLDVRNSLSVVAALLATITFTAGFTLPGGLDQDTGEAKFAKKAAFLVFLLSNTLAMCCSMLVLVCLIWSMVYDSSDSLVLIDRSMVLLILALYLTLLAFMTGVYIVISAKSLWAAIVIIVICCIMGISANRTLLYKVLLIGTSKTKEHNHRRLMRLLKWFKREPVGRVDLEKQN